MSLNPKKLTLYGISKLCNGNTHIYDNHINQLKEQLKREPLEFPKIKISDRNDLDIDNINLNDIEIINYNYHEKIIMEMRK